MSSQFPNGTIFSVSTALSAANAFTDATNAAPPVVEMDSDADVTNGDIVLINSSWAGIDGRVARLTGVAGGNASLEGLDTTDTDIYPPGEGDGSLAVVDSWVQISQVANVAKSGGDQQFFQWQYLEDRTNQQRQRPTFKNAKSITLTLDYDEAKAWYSALQTLDGKGELCVLRALLPSGAKLYYPVYVSFDADPTLNMNQNMQNTAVFSQSGQFIRYSA